MNSSLAEVTAASSAFMPSSILTMIDSDTTIALSTSIPSAMISAARDTWLRPNPARDINSNVVTITAGIRGGYDQSST